MSECPRPPKSPVSLSRVSLAQSRTIIADRELPVAAHRRHQSVPGVAAARPHIGDLLHLHVVIVIWSRRLMQLPHVFEPRNLHYRFPCGVLPTLGLAVVNH